MFVGAGGSLREREELVTDGNAVWASRDMADKVSQLKRRVVTIRERRTVSDGPRGDVEVMLNRGE